MAQNESSTSRPEQLFDQAVEGLNDVADYLKLDPVPPVWRELKRYDLARLKADLGAAAMVAIVTIPQAIAFALVVGIPVQAVLVTAIIGAAFCALFTTSRHLIFGPTNTVAIVLAGALITVAEVPLTSLQKVLVIGFMVGAIQMAAGFFKLGTLTNFVSRTVVIAYSTAVAVLIGVGQIGNLLGIGRADDVSLPVTVKHIAVSLVQFDLNAMTAATGIASLLFMVLLRRIRPKWPDGLIGLAVFGAVGAFYHLPAFGVPLVRDAGEVAGQMPLFVGFPTNENGLKLVPALASAALAMAILGMLETVSITKSTAARAGQAINPNQELLAIGAGNFAATAFGAMPGSASFVRTAVCFQSGGVSQMAAIFSAGIVLGILVLTASVVNYIPVATLAAYLVLVSVRLYQPEQIRIARRATRSDAIVFWVTLCAALFLKLDTAIYVGVGVSLALFLKKASAPSLIEYGFTETGELAQIEQKTARPNPSISIVHVEGELFFGAADLFQDQVRILADADDIRVVILRLKNARNLDASAVMALLQLHEYLKGSGRHLLISGLGPEVERVLENSGALREIGEENIFRAEANLTLSTKHALKRAKSLLPSASPDVRLFYDRKRIAPSSTASATTGAAASGTGTTTAPASDPVTTLQPAPKPPTETQR